jgi:hypothetical protein
LLVSLALAACGGATTAVPSATPATAPQKITTQNAIITPTEAATENELAQRGQKALLEQRWQDAVDSYVLLVKAVPDGANAATYLFDLAMAYDGLEQRDKARDVYFDLAKRFPASTSARTSLVRVATLDAFLEDWGALGDVADAILARSDIDDVDRMMALGARGLSKAETGKTAAARTDILDGLQLAEHTHYTSRDVLPVALAQLRFANGEVKRIESEQIKFDPLPADFPTAIEQRCVGLLLAQWEYAEAVHAADPHWATMAGYRVGEMYRTLHADLTAILPPKTANTEHLRQEFYAFMHIRYRVLLDKGMKQLDETLKFAERTNDTSVWIKRAKEAQHEMQVALDDEKAQIAKFPFTEAEVEASLKQLTAQVEREKARKSGGH